MTVIVGVEKDGEVWIGGDSAGVSNWTVMPRADSKVFRVGEFLYGIAGSFRGGNVLRYGFTPPARLEGEDTLVYLNTRFVDGLRAALAAAGAKGTENGVDMTDSLSFLLGYRGRLYEIGADFQVGFNGGGYAATGSGWAVALGALHATSGLAPEDRVLAALRAAEAHNIGVRGPFTIERLGGTP